MVNECLLFDADYLGSILIAKLRTASVFFDVCLGGNILPLSIVLGFEFRK